MTCPFNYDNTSQYFEVEKILAVGRFLPVYGKAARKLFYMKWKGLLRRQRKLLGPAHCSKMDVPGKESIEEFWLRTDINPTQDFYEDPDN